VPHLNQQFISADRADSRGIWTARTFASTQQSDNKSMSYQ